METIEKYFLHPGYIFVSDQPYLIHTVLGSCVSVCLWDCRNRFGGMNHFIYDKAKGGAKNSKYGNVSTSYIIRLMLEMGSHRTDLRAHIMGGGENPMLDSSIGRDNAAIAEKIIRENKIAIASKDVGGNSGRKVIFNNESGEILIYAVTNVRKSDWH